MYPALRQRLVTTDGIFTTADASAWGYDAPGLSRARVLFRALGLPEPELQVNLRDEQGFIGRVDFLFRAQRTVVEFDGAVKYDGSDGRRALVREKRREDRLRASGYQVVRLTWSDLEDPGRAHQFIRSAFARSLAGWQA